MNIGIDCRPLENAYRQRGIGVFVKNLLPPLRESLSHHRLICLGTLPKPAFATNQYARLFRPQWHSWWWEHLFWPFDLGRLSLDLLVMPVALGPLREIAVPATVAGKVIAVVHDLNAFHLPNQEWIVRSVSFAVQKKALARARAICAVSDFTRNDLIHRLGIPDRRITRISEAVDQSFRSAANADTVNADHSETGSFILTMGETENKNIETAVEVFRRCVEAGYTGTLRIVAQSLPPAAEDAVFSSGLRDRIVQEADVSTSRLVHLYRSCDCFLFPSRCEGVGLPLLEALYCLAPVVASSAGGLPETGANCVLYAPPDDSEEMARQVNRILHDPVLRADLGARGRRHVNSRSWEEAAETIGRLCEEAV